MGSHSIDCKLGECRLCGMLVNSIRTRSIHKLRPSLTVANISHKSGLYYFMDYRKEV
jgi:hypothetical protein